MSNTLLEREPVKTIDQQPLSAEGIQLIEKVIWGTEGARYTLTGVEPTLRHLPDASYLHLYKNDRLIGLRLILAKKAAFSGTPLESFYHSMFCIDPAEKGKGYGKQLAQATLESLQHRQGNKSLIYCHVEEDNENSLRIAKSLGYKNVGNFSAMSFSRFFPKSSARLSRLASHQKSSVIQRLNEQYAGHALTDFAQSLLPNDYYVLIDQGRIRAGLQADFQRWKIHSLAGAGGAIALHALPRMPLLRDLFNPQDFRFLKMGNIFFDPQHPRAIFELMEAVLAKHALKTAMFFWDKKSPVYQQMVKAGRLGFLNALTETPVNVMALFKGFSDQEITRFAQQPKVISPSDI